MFHVALKNVQKGEALPDIILKQHKGLSRQNVTSDYIANIINNEMHQRVLLMLDGHDEYTPGTSSDIDKAIKRYSLPNCCILLTSRDTKELLDLRPHIDVEAEITGFNPKKVKEYITKYLESRDKCHDLLQKVRKSNILSASQSLFKHGNGILQVPILLHMICVLYQRNVSLPKTMTGVIAAIVERCPDWDEIRRSGRKTDAEMRAALDTALVLLGKLCWKKLRNGQKDLIFKQVNVIFSPPSGKPF